MNFLNLNPQQLSAVKAGQGPLLIVAGAGTGKTKTLTSRIVYLLEQGIPSSEICALTFTNKAAKEMRERVEKTLTAHNINSGNLPLSSANAYIGTFHSLGARILRKEAYKVGRKANYAIYDDYDSLQVTKKAIKQYSATTSKLSPKVIAGKISLIKNKLLPLEGLMNSRRAEDTALVALYDMYEKELEANNAFDFDDLIEKLVVIFTRYPEVCAKYQRSFKYLLVDEYQDLNTLQYRLIKLLCKSNNISVVGDDQQTIYSWRGSNYGIFLNFEQDWPGAQVVMLEQNYRSSGNIIRAASGMIQHNENQRKKNLVTENEDGELVRITELPHEESEAFWIARDILSGKKSNPEQTYAILYRTNAQSRAIEQALIELRIPYKIYGGLQFYDRKEVKDAVAALRWASNPLDAISKERLEKGLSKTKFARFREKLETDMPKTPTDIFKAFLSAFEYIEYLEKNYLNSIERQENLAQLIHFASEFENASDFLEKVSLLQSTDTPSSGIKQDTSPSAIITLMTIHMAKGLEFDRVYVAGCCEGLLPHSRSLDTPEEQEEERRLLYVAMTRARRLLTLTFYDVPSRFLFEIPKDTCVFESFVSSQEELVDDEERYITLD